MEENQIIIDVGMDGLIESLHQLGDEYETNKKKIATLVDEQKRWKKAIEEMKKADGDYASSIAVLTAKIEENGDQATLLTQQNKVLRQEMTGVERQIQNEIKSRKAEEGSLVQLRAQLANLNKQYDSMSGMERMGEEGAKLQERIKKLHDEILGLEGATGRMQRNVGNYPEAVKPVQAQLREITQQLIELQMQGKENTAEFAELAKKAGEMKDAFADAQQEIKNLSSDTSNLDSVLQGAQLAAGAFSTALGVMTLFGAEDSKTAKELAEAQAKLQSAIAITTGLQAIQNALQKQSALMLGVAKIRLAAAAAAQRLYAMATRDATAAQEVFNKVAKSNVYVWLAGIILSVVGAIAAFTRGSKEQEEQLNATNVQLEAHIDVLKRITDGYQKLRETSIKYLEDHIDRLNDEGASVEEIRKAEDELFNQNLANMNEERQMYEKEFLLYQRRKDEYAKNLRIMQQLEQARLDAYEKGDDKRARFYQNEINNLQALMDVQRKALDVVDDWGDRYDQLWSSRRKQLAERKRDEEEAARRAAEAARQRAEQLKREREEMKRNREELKKSTDDLIGYFDAIKKGLKPVPEGEKDFFDQLREKYEAIDKAARESQERQELYARHVKETLGVDILNIDDSIMEKLEREANPLYNFSQTYKENAQTIQETSSALESSFGSLSSMYQQMANDESKSEAERAKSAKKAKVWAAMQIASNGGAAMAKGIAGAMDAPTLAGKFAALATMTATLIAAIAQAKSMLAGFEGGGVIGGRYVGASMGHDNTVVAARTGEIILNADQQKRLFDIANGAASGGMTSALVDALQAMPAPVMDYEEFTRFQKRVAGYTENSKLK